MTTYHTSRDTIFPPIDQPTIADVIGAIAGDAALHDRQRQDITSALRTMARALGRRPEEIPAHPGYLRKRLKTFAPAMAGLSVARWRNVLSLTRTALKHAGPATMPGRYSEPLAPEWASLFRYLNVPKLRYGLSRLARFCSEGGISPDAVDDELFGRFKDQLENGGIINNPRKAHRAACQCWNKAVVTIPEWPKQTVNVPNYNNRYMLPWSEFPSSLKADFDAFIDRLAGKDILAELDFTPLKPGSIATRTTQLREFMSAVVHRGHDPQTLSSLADLVAVNTVRNGLAFYIDRPENSAMKHALDIASLLRSIARHWVRVDIEHLDQLKNMCKRLKSKNKTFGMTDKNRAALRQFDDPANVFALVKLPQRLLAKSASVKLVHRRALMVQTALAIELLLMVSPRLENLAEIDLERHLIRSTKGNVVHLAVPGAEVKNGVDIEVELPPSAVRLIDLYLRDHRPVLLRQSSTYLFPGKSDGHLSHGALRVHIVGAVKDECGLVVTPHQFRHIAAKLYLDAHPGAYGVVRLVLGHKSVDTTTKYYCGVEGGAASRQYDEQVLKLRYALPRH